MGAVFVFFLTEIHFPEEVFTSFGWLSCLLTFFRTGCDQSFVTADAAVADRHLTFFSGETLNSTLPNFTRALQLGWEE